MVSLPGNFKNKQNQTKPKTNNQTNKTTRKNPTKPKQNRDTYGRGITNPYSPVFFISVNT